MENDIYGHHNPVAEKPPVRMQFTVEIPDEKAPFFMELMEHLAFKAIVIERETETEDHPKVSNSEGAER